MDQLVKFDEFLRRVSGATHATYSRSPGAKVSNSAAFADMQNHILKHYAGVQVAHSFVDESDQIFDCIPIAQQPSLRNRNSPPAQAPDMPVAERGRPTGNPEPPPGMDRFGNRMACPAGTVPVRRITLEELTRYESLRLFFRKTPGGVDRLPGPDATGHAADPSEGHRYAIAYQSVQNLGGHSFLKVCSPNTAATQMSLSQHWYSAGAGSNTQTVEVGWQVQPQKFGTKPVLFIYWTADYYQSTGCYNLDCSAFVQTNSAVKLGGVILASEIELAWYFYQGNWWLYYGGVTSSHALGYYPASIYKGGAMALSANQVQYGGETYGSGSWPPMGTGKLASSGVNQAAYQRNVYYFDTAHRAKAATLALYQPTPKCYTSALGTGKTPA